MDNVAHIEEMEDYLVLLILLHRFDKPCKLLIIVVDGGLGREFKEDNESVVKSIPIIPMMIVIKCLAR